MFTRKTHARIYQQDLSKNEYDEIERLANQMNTSVRNLILEAIRKYLRSWDSRFSLSIERVNLNNGGVRFYLWLPYHILDELELLMKAKGLYVQQLTLSAIREYNTP